MKTLKLIAVLAVVTLSLSPKISYAQKWAYVDTEYILSQMPEYRSAQNDLNQLSKEWQAEIDAMFAEIDKMYKTYQAEKVLLTKDMQTKRENEIIEKEREAKALQNQRFGYEGDLYKKRQELIKPIQDKVFEAIHKVAKNNGFDFIFDKSSDLIMLVANPKYDRSDEVLEELGIVPTDDKDTGGDGDLPPSNDGDLPPDN
ncbi:OmpH family outer membrane protein [bacterium]|nr:OmpH family outer membrane protein [bacterium]